MDPFEKLLRETLRSISYKGWSFRIEKDGIGLWFLQVCVNGPDSLTQAPITWGGRKWRLSMHMTKSELAQTALRAVLDAEEHEAREHFLYNGRAVFGPHTNIEKLWDLTGEDGGTEHRESR